jgi:enterochelin esterase-like enzyme
MQSNRHLLRFGDSYRAVTVCAPHQPGGGDELVLFCADGQNTVAFATEFFNADPGKTTLWFVGVDSCLFHRNAEYVVGRDERRFTQHESFLIKTVWQWVEQEFGLTLSRQRVGAFGYSCGGSFAVSMGIRHPDLFGTVLAFSVAGRPVSDFEHAPVPDISSSAFFLRAGSREPKGMRSYMKRLQLWLSKNGALADYSVSPGGHEFGLWSGELNAVLNSMSPSRK